MFNLFKIEKKMKKKILLFVCAILCASAMSAQINTPLCFTNVGDADATVKFGNRTDLKGTEVFNETKIQTSADAVTWADYTIDDVITLHPGDKVYFRNTLDNGLNKSGLENRRFYIPEGEKIAVSGNIMSMVNNATSITWKYCFVLLFTNCKGLVDASQLVLPATTLQEYCYYYLFQNCSNLVSAPKELPATTLVDGCYNQMFSGCSSLLESPYIKGKTIQSAGAMSSMFKNCTSLERITVNFTSWPSSGFSAWVNNVPNVSSFVFVCPSTLEMRYFGDSYVQENWTVSRDMPFELTVNKNGWASLYYNKALEIPSGVSAYYASSIVDNKIELIKVDNDIPASQGVVVSGNPGEKYIFDVIANATTEISGNLFEGVTSKTTCEENQYYVLDGAGTDVLKTPKFAKYNSTTLNAYKVYFEVQGSEPGAKIESVFAGDPTGIKSIAPAMSETKAMYNLQGVRVNQNYNGIVIMNGKKYLVK